GHGHSHGHSHDHSNTAVPRLAAAFALTAIILVAEVIGGVVANSLALLADAAHMAGDAAGLAVALIAAWVGTRPATRIASYGVRRAEVMGGVVANSLALLADAAHMAGDAAGLAVALIAAWVGTRPATRIASYGFRRAEVLAAMFNAVLVGGAAVWILFEAFRRWNEPHEVASGMVIVVAFIGLAANLIAAAILAGGRNDNMNIRAALLHGLVDALGSVGVLVSALVVRYTGFQRADTIMAVLIALLVVPQAWNLIRTATKVLLEQAPPT